MTLRDLPAIKVCDDELLSIRNSMFRNDANLESRRENFKFARRTQLGEHLRSPQERLLPCAFSCDKVFAVSMGFTLQLVFRIRTMHRAGTARFSVTLQHDEEETVGLGVVDCGKN